MENAQVEKTEKEKRAKTLYQLLSERELNRVRDAQIPDTLFTDMTVSSLMHISHCLDDKPLMNLEEALVVLIRRGGE